MANSQIIKRYTTNKICCLATNTVKTDRKIKYGSADALCCVAKDFRAQVFLKMIQCSPEVNNTNWYHAQLKLTYESKDPIEYDFASPLILNVKDAFIQSNDGTQTSTAFRYSGNYGILANINEVASAFANKFNSWGTSQIENSIFAFSQVDSDDPSSIIVDIYHDSTWGNNSDKNPSITNLNDDSEIPFDITLTLNFYNSTDVISSACFTEAQLCAMKRVIDNYCKNCN